MGKDTKIRENIKRKTLFFEKIKNLTWVLTFDDF
jgi:hypothetical protein